MASQAWKLEPEYVKAEYKKIAKELKKKINEINDPNKRKIKEKYKKQKKLYSKKSFN
ncbi:hypothetical protein G9A89_014719 [Geosiphon pyriformis]|nr:hypothetical protein G9A89_014719 [Geosiphon pyriformis]